MLQEDLHMLLQVCRGPLDLGMDITGVVPTDCNVLFHLTTSSRPGGPTRMSPLQP